MYISIRVSAESLKGDYTQVRKGDCIVAFSKNDIYGIRQTIESSTNLKCAVIYGQLPPETRSAQARNFNEIDGGYDILIASDAIGMGLNLNIKRVIFHTTLKSRGKSRSYFVEPSQVKQIGGRAGRKSSNYEYGEVTAWQEVDLAYIRAVMGNDVPEIEAAGIFPSVSQIELFSHHLLKHIANSAEDTSTANNIASDLDAVDNLENINATASGEAQVQGTRNILEDDYFTATLDELLNAEEKSKIDPKTIVTSPAPDNLSYIADFSLPTNSVSLTAVNSGFGRKPISPSSSIRLGTLLARFVEAAEVDKRYFLCDHVSISTISNWLQTIPMSLEDR